MDWSTLYSDFVDKSDTSSDIKKLSKLVEFADIGCGYGGLLGMFTFLKTLQYSRYHLVLIHIFTF